MNTIVKKSESMIKSVIYGKVNFVKLVNMAIAQINHTNPKYDSEGNIIAELPLMKTAEMLGYSLEQKPSVIKDTFSRLLKKGLKDNLITIKNTNEETEARFLITGYKTSVKKDNIVILFNSYFANMILVTYKGNEGVFSPSNRFIEYDCSMFYECGSAYTLALYELLKLYSYKKSELFFIGFEELKAYLDVKHAKVNTGKGKIRIKRETYLNYKDFKHDILSPAIKFINKNTDINISIVKEERTKYEYILNGENKTVPSVKKIYFKIDSIPEKTIKKDVMHPAIKELMASTKLSQDDVMSVVSLLKNSLKEKDGIEINENQVAKMLNISNINATLVKCAILDSNYRKVKDIGSYAYKTIEKVVADEIVDEYIESIRKKTIKVRQAIERKDKKKKEIFKLEGLSATCDRLVEVYTCYLNLTGKVTEKDVDIMTRCLVNNSVEKIKKAILNSYTTLDRKGRSLNSFAYVEIMILNEVFEGKKDITV